MTVYKTLAKDHNLFINKEQNNCSEHLINIEKSPLFTITTNLPTILDLLLKELIDTYLLTVDHPVDLCQEFRLQLVLRVLLYLVRSLHPQQLLLLQSLWKPNHQQTHLTTSGSWLSW